MRLVVFGATRPTGTVRPSLDCRGTSARFWSVERHTQSRAAALLRARSSVLGARATHAYERMQEDGAIGRTLDMPGQYVRATASVLDDPQHSCARARRTRPSERTRSWRRSSPTTVRRIARDRLLPGGPGQRDRRRCRRLDFVRNCLADRSPPRVAGSAALGGSGPGRTSGGPGRWLWPCWAVIEVRRLERGALVQVDRGSPRGLSGWRS